MKHTLAILAAFLFASPSTLRAAEAASARPNILFILSDDHALRTIGAYDNSIIKTPSIDRLAREGAVFNNWFVGNSICCPCRATLLTGKHSCANGVLGNSSTWNTKQWSYPREFGKAGYQTALIGKWHIKGNPTDEFQHWENLYGHGGQGTYYNPTFLSPDGSTRTIEGYETDIIADKAIDWLKQRDASKPFLLCAQFKSPHTPRTPSLRHMRDYEDVTFPEPATLFDDYSSRQPFVADVWMKLSGMTKDGLGIAPTAEEFEANPKQKMPEFLAVMNPAQRAAWHEVYDPRNREYQQLKAAGKLNGKDGVHYTYQRFIKDYVRTIAGLDDNIGRVLAYLDENGLSSNTIVIYSSDQGFFTGEHGWAEKRWMYEESFKAPLIMRYPGVIKPGTRIDALTQNIDLAPTLLTAVGLPVPKEVQGMPLQPVLGGNIPSDWRKDVLYTYYDGGTPKARGEYNMPRHMGVRDERYKLISFYDYKAWEFYDLKSDPNELHNCYDKPEYAHEVERMKTRLSALKEQFQIPEPPELVAKKKKRQSTQPKPTTP